jgi:acetylornithine/N-succinyldiaminopimelate aminotransferase
MTADTALAQYVLGNYGRYPIWPVRGEGPRVWDREGKAYLDFAGGVAVCPLGHADPRMVQAISQQAQTLIHVSNWYCIDHQAELARCLVEEVVGSPGKCFFSNSGAEANEGLIKLARRYGYQHRGITKPKILTFTGSFHGRTMGGMYATAQEKIYGGYGYTPEEMGFIHGKYNDLADLQAKLAAHPDIVAILLEPIQGESGVHAATPDFLRAIQSACHSQHMLLLMDEVQCGFGRAGHLCGWHAILPGDEIQPDGISWAKAMGGGFPIGSFWVKDRMVTDQHGQQQPLTSILGPGTHGTTYGGSPLACATSLAVIRAILQDDLCAHAITLGSYIAQQARSWQHPLIREVRQLGLFIGFELQSELMGDCGGKAASIYLAQKLLDAGLMVTPAGLHTIRWLSPLNITQSHAQEALQLLKSVLDALHTA